MILLTSSSDLLEVVTGASVSDIYVQASFVDLSSVNVLTPGRQNTIITTATTTTVVPSPAAGTNRALKNLCIFNSSASPCQVSILHTDGTNSVEIFNYTTQTGESIYWSEGRGFYVQDAQGNFKTGQTTTAAGSNGDIQYNNNGVPGGSAATATAAGTIDLPAGQVLKFSTDTGISRDSAGVLDIGNGTAADISGSVKAAILVLGTSFKLAASSVMTAISGAGTIIASALSSLGTAPSGDVLTADGSGNVKDSGTLLSALATLLSPAFTGTPTAPTQAALTNNTDIATTAYTDAAVAVETSRAETAEALKAPLVSPALTGTPTAPTASALTNNTQLATTAYADTNFKSPAVAGFRDDFIANPESSTAVTSGVTVVFDTCWQTHDLTVGGTLTGVSGTFANPGICQIITGATGTGDGITLHKTAAGVGPLGPLNANAGWEINIVFALAQTTNCAVRAGVCDGTSLSDPPNNGIYVEYDTANANTNTDFTLVTRSSSTSSYQASAVATDTSYHHIKIFSAVAGTIGMSVDGGTAVTTTTDVTASVMEPFVQILTRTAAAKTLNLDFYSYMAATGRSN